MHRLSAVSEARAEGLEAALERALDDLRRSREEIRELRADLRATHAAIVCGLCAGIVLVSVLH